MMKPIVHVIYEVIYEVIIMKIQGLNGAFLRFENQVICRLLYMCIQ